MQEGISGLGLIKAKMQWLAARQTLLSANVSNADTPGFKPRDMAAFDPAGPPSVALAATQSGHLEGSATVSGVNSRPANLFETRPSGNSVSLEDEMLKVSQTQMEHQTLAGLYQRHLGYLKTAIGRKA